MLSKRMLQECLGDAILAIKAQDAEIDSLREELEELRSKVEKLTAPACPKTKKVEAKPEPKRGRGRPRKNA